MTPVQTLSPLVTTSVVTPELSGSAVSEEGTIAPELAETSPPTVETGDRKKPAVFFLSGYYVHSIHEGRAGWVRATGASSFLGAGLFERLGEGVEVFDSLYPQGGYVDPNLPPHVMDGLHRLFFAISLYDYHFVEVQAATSALRRLFPDARLVLGGATVNSSRDIRALAGFFPDVDALVKGDGDKIFPELVDLMSYDRLDREAVLRLKGVYVRDGSFVHCNDEKNELTSDEFNSLPIIVDPTKSVVDALRFEGFLDMSTSRGCVHNCSICSLHSPSGLFWSAERVVGELRRARKLIGSGRLPAEARNIRFTDADFIQNRQRAKELFRLVTSDPEVRGFFNFMFDASVASFYGAGKLDAELLDLIERAGVSKVVLGIDGFTDGALKFLRKGYTLKMAEALLAELKERHVNVKSYAIMTYPQMDRDSLLAGIANMLRVSHDFDVMFEGTITYPIAREDNAVKPLAADPQYVEADGARFMLPAALKLRDPALQRDLDAALQIELFGKPMLRALSEMGDPVLRKWREAFISDSLEHSRWIDVEGRHRFGFRTDIPENLTIEDVNLSHGSTRYVGRMAVLRLLYSALKVASFDDAQRRELLERYNSSAKAGPHERKAEDLDLVTSAFIYMCVHSCPNVEKLG